MSGSFSITNPSGNSFNDSASYDSATNVTSAALGFVSGDGGSDQKVAKLASDLQDIAGKVPGVDLSDGLSEEEISKIKDYIKENGLEDQYKDLMKALDDEDLLNRILKMINGEVAPASGGGKSGGGEKGGGEKGGGGGGGGEKAGGKGDLANSPLAKLDTDNSGTLETSELDAADTDGDKSLSVSELEDAGLTSEEAEQAMTELSGSEGSVGSMGVGIEFSDILSKYGASADEPVA